MTRTTTLALIMGAFIGVLHMVPVSDVRAQGMSFDSWLNGAVRIGPSTLACNTTVTEGALRWSSANGTFEMCDGTSWKLLVANGGTGTPSSPPAGTGYFVLSNGTSSGDMGGSLSAANALCLADLQANNWLNKDDAVSRGLLNIAHVEAFLCVNTGGTCNNALANTTYTFAVSGAPSTGGATFTTDGSGRGPGNTQNWSGINYFGAATYWTHRSISSVSLWGTAKLDPSCNGWGSGGVGNSNNSDGARFNAASPGCVTNHRYVCMVHPGNESSTTNGYLVFTSSTWNGNLGGQSGAHAKCLTELTTNTDWMGYAAANANGQLTASKVYAFGQCGTNGGVCSGSTLPSTTYNFAVVGDSSKGGASFTTNGGGIGPNDNANWGGTAYFGTSAPYWSSRNESTDTQWATTGWAHYCSDWTSSSNGVSGGLGYPSNTNKLRWEGETNPAATCDTLKPLVCIVNP